MPPPRRRGRERPRWPARPSKGSRVRPGKRSTPRARSTPRRRVPRTPRTRSRRTSTPRRRRPKRPTTRRASGARSSSRPPETPTTRRWRSRRRRPPNSRLRIAPRSEVPAWLKFQRRRPIDEGVKERLPLLAGLLLLACAAPKVGHDAYPDAPLALYRSFGILEAKAREEAPEDPRFGPLLDRHTEDAIDAALRSRGYQLQTEGDVDFLVSYSNEIRLEQRHRTTSPVRVGVGYGTYVGSGVGIGTGWYGPSDVTSQGIAKGTLVHEVLDARARAR